MELFLVVRSLTSQWMLTYMNSLYFECAFPFTGRKIDFNKVDVLDKEFNTQSQEKISKIPSQNNLVTA